MKKFTCGDYLITGEIVLIGLAEAAHLTAVFLGRSFSQCASLFRMAAAALAVAALAGVIRMLWRRRKKPCAVEAGGMAARKPGAAGKLIYGVFVAVVLAQLIFIGMGGYLYRQGDMTVETVGSFLQTDAVYQVNPMTGLSYTAGIPSRLKILCLPSLYGFVCDLTGLSPALVVQTIVPIVVLLSSYVAFGVLGSCLFPENPGRRACFLVAVALVIWAGAYMYGMDGFNLLCSGWRGVVIRNSILLPWLLSLCIRRNWLPAVLCVLAEACIVWTLYGMGACLFVAVGMAAVQWCCGKFLCKAGADARGGKEKL